MRQRKNPTWEVRTFKFHVEPRGEIPQALWDVATTRRLTWNALCELRAEYLERYLPQRETMDAEAKKRFWSEFMNAARARVDSAGLDWENAGDLYDHFLTAHQMGFKVGHGPPKPREGLNRVRLVHRYSGGGWDIHKICSLRAERFALRRLPNARHYTSNARAARRSRLGEARFGIGETSLQLRVNLHRELPRDALVKGVALCGDFVPLPNRAWNWHVVVTVETPPQVHAPRSPRHAALDLGWRIFDDYVRIGYLYDDDENEIELRLPLDFGTAQARRQGYPCDHRELAELESKIGLQAEAMKAKLRALNVPPPRLAQMRQGGLIRYLRELEGRQEELGVAELVAVEELRAWRHENDRLQTRFNKAAARFVGRRRWVYRNLAAWLTKEYGVLAWEGDLSIKNMAEAQDKLPALKNSMTWRQIAAIGELREMIRHAARKNNCAFINAQTAYSTVTCNVCGESAEQTGAMWLECENGHRWDQDANAALNLFSQIPAEIDTEIDLRERGDEGVKIPPQLCSVAVIVHSLE